MSDGDLIDKMLTELDEKNLSKNDKKVLEKTRKDLAVDVQDIDNIAENLVTMTTSDREKADKIFEMFFTSIGLDKDHSQASKEALTKALELKIEASKNLIELLKIKTKAQEMKTNIGFVINSVPGKKAGLSIDSMRKGSKNS
jgi:hypothetical protein